MSSTPRSHYHRRLSWLVAFAVAMTCILAYAQLGPGSGTTEAAEAHTEIRDPPLAVSAIRTLRSEVAEFLAVTGSVAAREEILAGAIIDGVAVVQVLADAGDWVSEGQLLARLDDSGIKSKLAQNSAELEKVEASIRYAEASITEQEAVVSEARDAEQRGRKLQAKDALSKEAYKTRETSLLVANARLAAIAEALNLERASKALALAQRGELLLALSRTEVRAQAAGVILSKASHIGQIVSNGSAPLFRIARGGEMELEVDVFESKLEQIRIGQPVQLRLASGQATAGEVRSVAPAIDPVTRTAKVRVALPGGAPLRIGQFVKGRIELDRHQGILVPATAILQDGENTSVFVVSGGKARIRDVVTGIKGPAGVEILSGLAEGEKVAAKATGLLNDGDQVMAIEDSNAGSPGGTSPPEGGE